MVELHWIGLGVLFALFFIVGVYIGVGVMAGCFIAKENSRQADEILDRYTDAGQFGEYKKEIHSGV